MDRKFLQKLAIVFVVLLAVYLVTIPRNKGVNVDELVNNVVWGFSAEDVSSIEIYKETGEKAATIQLSKIEGEWRVLSHYNAKGNKSKIDRLLTDVLEMTGKVRSEDQKHLDTYKIGDTQGVHMVLKDESEKPLANLIIGKRSEDTNSGFVRVSGFDKVYAVDKNLLSSLSISGEVDTLSRLKQTPWVELQAVDKKAEDYTEVALVSGSKNVQVRKVQRTREETVGDSTVSKEVTEWALVKGKREIDLDQKEINNFFRDIGKIRATEVVDQISNSLMQMGKVNEYGFGRPKHYIVFQRADGTRENVIFGKPYDEDKGYYIETQDDGLVYKLSKYNFEKVTKWVDDLPKKTI